MIIDKRATCRNGYTGQLYECDGIWDSWARWLLLGLLILAFIFIFFLFSCISARRRRRYGQQPFRGTGWANRYRPQQPHQNPPNSYYAYQQPAPPYEPNPAYTQPGYRNEQSTGIELNRPEGAYHGEYAPPPGPPPAKK